MATLTSPILLFELVPLKLLASREKEKWIWIETRFYLRVDIQEKLFTIEPLENPRILLSNLAELIKGIKQFINMLQQLPEDTDPIYPIEPYLFTPLTLNFELECINGDISDDATEGEITIRVMANLAMINQNFSSEYVGCMTNVEIENLLRFVNDLEMELESIK